MSEMDKINDKLFRDTFRIKENVRTLMKGVFKKILEKIKIEGGEIMETLGQRLRDEGNKNGKRWDISKISIGSFFQ